MESAQDGRRDRRHRGAAGKHGARRDRRDGRQRRSGSGRPPHRGVASAARGGEGGGGLDGGGRDGRRASGSSLPGGVRAAASRHRPGGGPIMKKLRLSDLKEGQTYYRAGLL